MLTFETKEDLAAYLREELLGTGEATELLGFSRQYLFQLVSSGKLIPAKESGRERLFWREDLLKFKK